MLLGRLFLGGAPGGLRRAAGAGGALRRLQGRGGRVGPARRQPRDRLRTAACLAVRAGRLRSRRRGRLLFHVETAARRGPPRLHQHRPGPGHPRLGPRRAPRRPRAAVVAAPPVSTPLPRGPLRPPLAQVGPPGRLQGAFRRPYRRCHARPPAGLGAERVLGGQGLVSPGVVLRARRRVRPAVGPARRPLAPRRARHRLDARLPLPSRARLSGCRVAGD